MQLSKKPELPLANHPADSVFIFFHSVTFPFRCRPPLSFSLYQVEDCCHRCLLQDRRRSFGFSSKPRTNASEVGSAVAMVIALHVFRDYIVCENRQ